MNHKIKLTQHTTPIRPGAQWPCGRGTAVGLLSSRREGLRPLPPTLPRSVDHAPTYQMYRVSFDSNLVLTGETAWKKKKNFPSIPPRHRRNTARTPQKHHQNMSRTPKKWPNIVKTLRTHHKNATKTPTTTETLFRDHQDTSSTDTIRTNATNSRKACKGRLPKSCCQLPNEYMQGVLRQIYRCNWRSAS